METVVGVVGSDEEKIEETGVNRNSSALYSPKQIASPVVYKLVRVEVDGRLVPATDDEVMKVEDFLEHDKTEMCVIADTGQSVGCISLERSSSGKLQLECSKGGSQSDNMKTDPGKLNARVEEIVPSSVPSLDDNHNNLSGTVGECSGPLDGPIEIGSSASSVCTSLRLDFSMLQGELCLDKLSIRELHELFRVTFGRETTVKDKQWLKRRIAMGLTNSCDVSTTSFIIKDDRWVKKDEEESCKIVDPPTKESTVGAMNINCNDPSTAQNNQNEENHIVSEKRPRDHNVEYDFANEDLQAEQSGAKRIRKPTRRYIEELSEVDSRDYNQRMSSASKNTGLAQMSSKSCVRSDRNSSSEGRRVVTRLDSIGGSGIQVPYVSRVRRSRPRKNIMSLMKFHPAGMDMAAELVNKALEVHGPQPDSESDASDCVMKSRSATRRIRQPCIAEREKDKQYPVMGITELEQDLTAKQADSCSYTSDDNIVTVPTAKGGMRRKHHRAWTLVEVMKLVEGVSRCGAGRWSEIKRLAFASYSYRTSVDLKDKWRNLLKASFAQAPVDEGFNSRKHGSAPIPEQILVRVRELAELNAQVPPNLSSGKLTVGTRSVQDASSGYL
ncbi:Telomere repeat-binding protein 6 [Quillaja saponaria]|uniref:Telomere repeat-binding protein 6 n=1 Tax=Quillaja saponaria TaxID=32244 RepID=A0AAD7PPY7_QUISA|nr:Telomere repeat-binding protein 6 [Quillaja saponaria]